jgi:hypothetical protein
MKRRAGPRQAIRDAVERHVPGLGDDGPTFMQGLAIGALVGAAIAGSTLWSRFQSRRVPAELAPDESKPAELASPMPLPGELAAPMPLRERAPEEVPIPS